MNNRIWLGQGTIMNKQQASRTFDYAKEALKSMIEDERVQS
jgi:phage gp46-like protein